MRIDRNAAAIIRNGQAIARFKADFDPRRMARNGFVHCIVENFGREMVIGAFVRAANIHAGAPTNRLKTLQHLNR